MTGHFKKADVAPMKVLREVRIGESKDETKVATGSWSKALRGGELVDVSGVSKGKGLPAG
jgi:large subunit ribosomal protein L3